MMRRNKILFFVVIAVLAAGLFAYFQFNKPHQDIANATPVAVLTADELFSEFENNEAESNSKYLGKIVEVNGEVVSVKESEKGDVNVILLVADQLFGVACNFGKKEGKEIRLKPGDAATIKGECAGMLSDVVLIRCVIVKNRIK